MKQWSYCNLINLIKCCPYKYNFLMKPYLNDTYVEQVDSGVVVSR